MVKVGHDAPGNGVPTLTQGSTHSVRQSLRSCLAFGFGMTSANFVEAGRKLSNRTKTVAPSFVN